jgi:hypothetical protein
MALDRADGIPSPDVKRCWQSPGDLPDFVRVGAQTVRIRIAKVQIRQ